MTLIEQSAAITFVLVLLWVVLFWLKRNGLAGGRLRVQIGPREMEMIQRLALTPQHSLHLVRLKGSNLLLAVYPGGVTVIREMESQKP